MRKPYLLRTPQFSVTSGGVRVMYGLYGWLLAKGEVAFLNAQVQTPAIGIYPEIYSGNEMNCTKVVRYILNTPGVMGLRTTEGFTPGPTKFDPLDSLYYFSKMFGEAQDENHYLFLPIINTKVFTDKKQKRPHTAYIIGKGENKLQHPKDAIELTPVITQDQEKLAAILNTCHSLYVYDDLSAIMEVARLCGCKVKYFGKYYEEDLINYEPGIDGISFGLRENNSFDSDAFRERYLGMVDTFSKRLDIFIEETQS